MTAENLTSVIMVTRQTGPVLWQAIEAVWQQTAEVELVLVNNGNPPEVEAELARRFKDDPKVRLMTGHGNIGMAKACNLGARVAQGSRLLFLSPFALIPADLVARFQTLETKISYAFMFGARLVNAQGLEIEASRQPIPSPGSLLAQFFRIKTLYRRYGLKQHLQPLPQKIIRQQMISRTCLYIPKPLFDEFSGFQESFDAPWDDYEFAFRCQQKAVAAYFVPMLTVKVLQEANPPRTRQENQAQTAQMSRYLGEVYGDSHFNLFIWFEQGLLWAFFGIRHAIPLLMWALTGAQGAAKTLQAKKQAALLQAQKAAQAKGKAKSQTKAVPPPSQKR